MAGHRRLLRHRGLAPRVADCDKERKDGAVWRTLSVKGGGTILEKRTEKTATSYSYDIVDTPLPVADYHATFKVTPAEGGGTTVDWMAHFHAKGASDAEAAAVMAGIFEAGLNNDRRRAQVIFARLRVCDL